MPRGQRRRTATGEPAQKVASVPGQRYGEGIEQQQLQRAMPAANVTEISTGSGSAPEPEPQRSVQDLLGDAPLGLLAAPGDPNRPITTGLEHGPGAGPEALRLGRTRTPIARTLETLAARTGDPWFRELLEKAGL